MQCSDFQGIQVNLNPTSHHTLESVGWKAVCERQNRRLEKLMYKKSFSLLG